MMKVLVYAPSERIKPAEAMAHPYFNEIRGKKSWEGLQLFNFTRGKFNY